MQLSLLAYAIPLFGLAKAFALFNPKTYQKYETAAYSRYSETVKAVAERALAAAQSMEQYGERVTDLLEGVANGQISHWVAERLKVAELKDEKVVHSTGTDLALGGSQGRYYIGVHPEASEKTLAAMPWIVSHEVCHLLEGDWTEVTIAKAVASLAAVVFSTWVCAWTFLPAVGSAIVANVAAYGYMMRRAEQRADEFATRICAPEELDKAIAFLEEMKNERIKGIRGLGEAVWVAWHQGSEESRIQAIRQAKQRQQTGLIEQNRSAV